MKTTYFTICLLIFLAPITQITSQSKTKSGYVAANGVKYYYEIHGTRQKTGGQEGEPLLLLHGGLGSIEMFEPDITTLSKNRTVIAVDLQGHGRTELGNRPIRYVDLGDDMAVILKHLKYDRVDAMGYSMGGAVAFRFAVQHPQMVRRLVLVSAGFAQDGFYPEMLPMQATVGAAMADQMKESPMYKGYAAVAPHPEDFPKLLDRMGELMRTKFDWSEDVKKLTIPVMLIYGDADMFRLEHVVQFYHLLGGGLKDAGWQRENMSQNRLAILPNLTHYEMAQSPMLVETALPFLNGESGVKISGGQK
ncbi:MAG: alpha/beta hydrolase [Ignavibacteriales bacterium]|nr:alpha/beta hydrolase [Ignavibacteriales bacterium]